MFGSQHSTEYGKEVDLSPIAIDFDYFRNRNVGFAHVESSLVLWDRQNSFLYPRTLRFYRYRKPMEYGESWNHFTQQRAVMTEKSRARVLEDEDQPGQYCEPGHGQVLRLT